MEFTTREYADMHFIYGFCDGNARSAQREYQARYPDRRLPSHSVFSRLHQRLVEGGTVHKRPNEVGHIVHDVGLDEAVLNSVRNDPEVSSRQLARDVGVSQWKVLDVLHKNKFHPYHFTPVQGLEATDYAPRVQFCRWLLNRDIEERHFFRKILWTDESLFTRAGIFNSHNMHHWDQQNPHRTREQSFQTRFSINIWCGILGDQLIGPHIFDGTVNGTNYLDFLQHALPNLLDGLNNVERDKLIFQQDGAPPHFNATVRQWLNENYPEWIGRGGTVAWPARSPDLTPMDFFVWGFFKQEVYSTPVNSEEELRGRIGLAAQRLREKLSFKVTVGAMRKRARACVRKEGRHFENELQ